MSVLAVDVGTSGVRAAVVQQDSSVESRSSPRGTADFSGARFRRVQRCRDGRSRARCCHRRARRKRERGRGRDHQSASLDDRLGPCHGRAGRAGHRMAGSPHCRLLPGAPGTGDPARSQPDGGQACRPAGHRRSWPRSRPVRRDGRHLGRLDAVAGRGPRLGHDQPRRYRPPHRRRLRLGRSGARSVAHPTRRAAAPGGFHRDSGTGERVARLTADRRVGRRPASIARRPGLRPARTGQGHLRHGRDARSVCRRGPPAVPLAWARTGPSR